MMKQFFITGTDTGVGKTLVSTVLLHALQGQYWKPIQSGIEEEIADMTWVQQFSGLSDAHFFSSTYALKAPLSPDQAAKLENITIDLSRCVLPNTSEQLIVEGAGGVFVPLNENECLLDLMKKFQLPIIIVCRGTLGTINHSLLTIQTLRHFGLPIHGIIFNGKLNKDSQAAIEKWGKVRTLFCVPHFENLTPVILQKWVMENKKQIQENFYESCTT